MAENTLKPDIREMALKHGFSYPTDEELLMMILGTGTKNLPVAKLSSRVADIIYSSNQENLLSNLMKIPGMGKGKALSVMAALELGKRKNKCLNAKIRHPCDVIPFIRNYSVYPKEHFLCITLDGSHQIIQIRVVSIGTLTNTIVHPREIFSEALVENASGIIVCHNHPSGVCTPSDEDISTTKNLLKSSYILGIDLLDHIIFSQNDYFSFMENNLLFTD